MSAVTPTSAEVDGAVETRAGAPLRLTCHSSACNPQCKVQWTVDGRLVDDFTQRHSLADGAHGGYVTASNVTINVGAGRKTDLHVVCSVVNDQMEGLPIHAEHKVAVLCEFWVMTLSSLADRCTERHCHLRRRGRGRRRGGGLAVHAHVLGARRQPHGQRLLVQRASQGERLCLRAIMTRLARWEA